MKNYQKSIIISITFLIILSNALALSFTQSPSINAGNTEAKTLENLTCEWESSGDTTNTTVTWYNGSTLIHTENTATSPEILLYNNTTKSETWFCNVSIDNGTIIMTDSDSIDIVNTLPYAPILYNSTGSNVGSEITLKEDQTYTFDLNSTDADGDTITYSHDANDGFCSILSTFNSNTGTFNCNPTNNDLNSPETPITKQIFFNAKDGGTGQGENLIVDITIMPSNDQASFGTVPSGISIDADQQLSYTVTGTDEESNTPLNFTLESPLNILQITNITDTSAVINFTTDVATNNYVGNWTVNLSLTDSYGSNATRQPARHSFIIEILRTNHDPQIISDPSITQANQTELYTNYIYGNDTDSINNLTWNITIPLNSSAYCMENFPWNINTINKSPENSTGLINQTITNDHVICRYVNISLKDNEDGADYLYTKLNVLNKNDPPVMHQLSEDGNISSKLIHRYSISTYKINATDIDSLTYDSENTANLLYSVNDTTFIIINNRTGIITMNPTEDSHVGNWTLNITVSDGEFTDWKIMNLTVRNNTAPELTINRKNYTFQQNDKIEINFSILERNNESITINLTSHTSFNESNYLITTISNNYSNSMNNQSNILNLTKTTQYLKNKMVGIHNITLTSFDELNSTKDNVSNVNITIKINNENDAPIFDQDRDNQSDIFDMGIVVQNIDANKTIHITDYDIFLSSEWANESVNLSTNKLSSGLNNLNITKVSGTSNSFYLTFTPTITGDAWILLNATDSSNVSTLQNVTFEILTASNNPNIEKIKPYQNNSQNMTEQFINATLFPQNIETLNITENTTVTFDAIITNDSTIPNNTLKYEWYLNDNRQSILENVVPGTNSSYVKSFDFWSNGTYNISLVATDQRLSNTKFVWQVIVRNYNRPPIYYNDTLEDLQVNYSSEFVGYMSHRNQIQRFYDPDDDIDKDGNRSLEIENESSELTYELNNPEACSLATFSFSDDTLRITPRATGICIVKFTATDIENESVMSDDVTITVIGATPEKGSSSATSSGGSSTNTRVITVPIEEEVDVPKPIKIISPIEVDTYLNRTIYIPITIKNTWEEAIKGITLKAVMNEEGNVTYSFDREHYSSMPAGGEETSILSITNYRTDGPFEITISASVMDPEFTDSSTILINSLEQTDEGKEVTAKVTFARDMLSENPECRELTELLDRAQKALNSLDYKQSLKLVNGVINGCKYLMNEENIIRKENPGIIEKSFELLDYHADKLVIGSGVLLILTIAFYVIAAFKKLVTENSKEK